MFEMKTQPFPSSEETDPRLLEALASLNQISSAINHIGSDDAGQDGLSLQLIVDSAIRVVPGFIRSDLYLRSGYWSIR